ncbi:MAG: hypothetical protein JXB48_03990 [Candidatus Latescibacteria bacterium]|nr:hypothetical protein [Candidatus Latescibacterota bacterium]
MKRLKIYLYIIIFVFYACSDSTGPDNDTDSSGDNNTVIDQSGGTIKIDEVEIIVPAGAFSEAVELKVSDDVEQINWESVITKTYQLEGIPSDFKEPITVRLKYEGELSIKSYIVIGNEIPKKDMENLVSYSFLPSEKSGQYLESVINPFQTTELPAKYLNKSQDDIGEQLVLYFFGLSDYQEYTTNGGHFHFVFPLDVIENVVELGTWLEETYEMFYNLGFDYSLINRWTQISKVSVRVLPFTVSSLSTLEEYAYSLVDFEDYDNEIYKMSFNLSKFSANNLDTIKIAAGCAFFEMVLNANNLSEKDYGNWFIKACKTWSGELFTSETNYVPSDFIGNETIPLSGFEYQEKNYREYGYGMSALVKYLCDENCYGKKLLPLIFGEIRKGADIINAIVSSIDDSPEKWWPGFLSSYISGNIYNQPPSTFTSEEVLKGEFTLTESDSVKSFHGMFCDLAADIYSISIDQGYFDHADTLSLSVESTDIRDDYITILLFAHRSDKLEYLCSGNEIVLTDIGEITEDNTVLAVVANCFMEYPYHDDIEYTLTVNVEKQIEDVPMYSFNSCFIRHSLHGHYITSWGAEIDEKINPYGFDSDGILHGTQFTGDFNKEANGLIYEGNITCVFDESFNTINSIIFKGKTSKVEDYYQFTFNFTAQNIGLYKEDWEGRHYRITGSQFSSNLTSFESRLEWTTKFNDEYWKELTQLNPGDEYYIEIRFYDE